MSAKTKGLKSTKPTPKIHGFLAADKKSGLLILKEGKKNTLVSVDYTRHPIRFTVGATFFGKIYVTRSALSPDGRYFVYFAMGTKWYKSADGRSYSCWNAICRPPSITAELFLPCGDTWGGAAFFYGKKKDQLFISRPMYPEYEPEAVNSFGTYGVNFDASGFNNACENKEYYTGDKWHVTATNEYGVGCSSELKGKRVSIQRTSKYSAGVDHSNFGEFDSYHYEIRLNRNNSLIYTHDDAITWADIDLNGRLWVTKGSKLMVYADGTQIYHKDPDVWDLAELIVDQSH